jgi:hypothetical protein
MSEESKERSLQKLARSRRDYLAKCSGKAHMPRPQTIGSGIWRVIVYRNGPPGLGAH